MITSENDPRRLIARLAAAIVASNGHVTAPEIEALDELDLLGLGRLSEIAREEMMHAVEEPIDVQAACDALAAVGPETLEVVLTVLARVATSNGAPGESARRTFEAIATALGVPTIDAVRMLDAAAARRARPSLGSERRPGVPPERGRTDAERRLGVEAGASLERLEAAYLAAVERYAPAKLAPLGAEFVALAVRKLAALTEAFEEARAQRLDVGPASRV